MGKYLLPAIILLLCASLPLISCADSSGDPHDSINSLAEPFGFSMPQWEIEALGDELWESLKPASGAKIDDMETVNRYFAAVGQGDPVAGDLENEVERIISKQIRSVLIEERIVNPLDTWLPLSVVFPPVNFSFQTPPNLLVVSPRNEIRMLKRITLKPHLTPDEKEALEEQVDSPGYSSLVVRLGGVGFTYPTMVYRTSSIKRAIDIAVEEWFHQYMAFRPLGFLYVMDSIGWWSDYDIITINETTAGIVSRELAEKVYDNYYREEEDVVEPAPPDGDGFDFNREMNLIRSRVDEYLEQGKVAEAEGYMEDRRRFLASKGYNIRKLNQAYFAFHGTYADDPGTVSPIGRDLQLLRKQCSSLKDFLEKVSVMRGYEDLKKALEGL